MVTKVVKKAKKKMAKKKVRRIGFPHHALLPLMEKGDKIKIESETSRGTYKVTVERTK